MTPACSTCGMAVEFLRSCYSSEWQLFRNSTQRTKGRYYFCDDATPFYPGFHNLASRVWNDANWPHSVRLGEVTDAKHTYYRGDPPAVPALPRAVGNAECIQLGDRITDAVPAADLIDGFVPRCMIDDAWARVSSYNQCATRRVYAALIVQLYAHDDFAIRATIADWLGDLLDPEDYRVTIRHHAGVMPGIISIVSDSWTAFVLDGTSNFQEVVLQAFAFALPPQNFGIIGTAGLWYQAGSYVLQHLATDGLEPHHRVMCVGHSYGGATAQVIAARLRHADQDRGINFLTLGSPKIGDTSFVDLVRACRGWNIAAVDDPIPVLPPDARELVWLLPRIAWPAMTNWGFWKRPPNQVFMDHNGILFTRDAWFLDSQTLLSIVEALFHRQQISPFSAHASAEYLRRIQRQCPEPQWPVDEELAKKIWLPEAVLTMTGKRPPSRDGALVFCYSPIDPPTPGNDCLTSLLRLPGESFHWTMGAVEVDWFRMPVEAGHTYTIRQNVHSGLWGYAIIFEGVDCPSQIFIGACIESSPEYTNVATASGYWFVAVNSSGILGCEYTLQFEEP